MARRSSAAACANCVFRTIYSAKNAEYQLAAHMLGHVVAADAGRGRDGRRAQSARPGRSRAPTNTGCGGWRSGKGARSPTAAAAAEAAARRANPGARARRRARQENGGGEARKRKGGRTMKSLHIGVCADRAARVRRHAGGRAGHAEDRDRADQQLGEPGADARRGRRHLQEAQSQDRGVRHAGRGRDHSGGGVGLGRSRRGRRRRGRDARVLARARRCASCCRPSPAPATSTGT